MSSPMSDATPRTLPLPKCPLCGCNPTFGILGARGPSVWCIGPCPLSYGTFTPDEWHRLASPPVHDTVREVLRARLEIMEAVAAGDIAGTEMAFAHQDAAVVAWIAAGRPGLEQK